MLSGGDDPRYRSLVNGHNEPVFRAEVWKGGVRVDTYGDAGLPILSGTMIATLGNRVTRTAVVRTDPALFPWAAGDLLDPFEAELRLFAGLRGGAGEPFMYPIFRGICDCSIDSSEATMAINATDLVEPILAARFDTPYSVDGGQLVTTQVLSLVRDSYPEIILGDFEETYATTTAASWDSDRGAALDDLAELAGCHWYLRADGALMLRVIPWSAKTYDPADVVATFVDGAGLLSATTGTGRDNLYNQVVVSVEVANGEDPIYVSVVDDDPGSRTYVNGPLGYRTLTATSVASSEAEAERVARSLLARSLSRSVDWTARTKVDPSLELGDICRLEVFGRRFDLALTTIKLSLAGTDGVMETGWRSAGGLVDV